MILKMLVLFFMSCLIFPSHGNCDWAETALSKMSLEEKIGQLFIIPACPARGEEHLEDVKKTLHKYHVGGIIVKHAKAKEQVNFLNRLQEISTAPLLIAADAEWGLGMRMEDAISFPKNLTLGAIVDDNLIYLLGKEIGRQCKKVGIHLNLAPVVDVNTNPRNPIIHMRSFGDDPYLVSRKGIQLMKGMQSAGVLACAKHFPGHGDVSVDSHEGLPILDHSIKRLENVELIPFKTLAKEGISAIMSGHLFVPVYDRQFPSSLSYYMITKFLKEEWGYKGLLITDALNMKALSGIYASEDIALYAFLAGHDLLLYGDHMNPEVDMILHELIPKGVEALKKGYMEGLISLDRLNESVLKILQNKQGLQLHENRIVPELVLGELHLPAIYKFKRDLFRSAITLYSDEEGILPLSIKKNRIAYVQIGAASRDSFYTLLKHKQDVSIFSFEGEESLIDKLKDFDVVIVGLYGAPSNGLPNGVTTLLETLNGKNIKTIVSLFGTPYAVSHLPKRGVIIVGYEPEIASEEAISEIIFGEFQAKGKLPISS